MLPQPRVPTVSIFDPHKDWADGSKFLNVTNGLMLCAAPSVSLNQKQTLSKKHDSKIVLSIEHHFTKYPGIQNACLFHVSLACIHDACSRF